jgi:hypothetical protein
MLSVMSACSGVEAIKRMSLQSASPQLHKEKAVFENHRSDAQTF